MRRKLAAILVGDMVGYSRLMQQDEAGTHAGLRALRREILEPGVEAHQGRIFKTTGDGFLAEFTSAVDAARCAVEMQRAIRNRNERPDVDAPIQFRMGINLGDVIVEDDDLYGDGINIAARLETLARPGAVCVSEMVYQVVRGKFDCRFEDLGPQRVKNISEPIRAYRLELAPREVPVARAAEPVPTALPNKPSIAVLPFANISDDPSQDYFAEGIAEELITALSRHHWFFVIARNSSFAYRSHTTDARQIAQDLGVRYLLQGSVQRAAARLRISCQLIQADSARNIWADRYDGLLEDVFALQDSITESVVGAIEPPLRGAEIERAHRKAPENLDAYDLLLRALPPLHRVGADCLLNAESLLEQAVAIEPDYGHARALIAWCHTLRVSQRWSSDPIAERQAAIEAAKSALRVDRNNPETLALAGYTLAFFDDNPYEGIALIDRSLSLNPNAAQTWVSSGWVRVYNGDAKTAIRHFLRGLRLSPLDPVAHRSTTGLAYAHMFLDDFEEAVAWAERAITRNDNYLAAYRVLAASLAHLGRLDEAQAAITQHQSLAPGLTLEKALTGPVRHPAYAAITRAGLQLAWERS